jgi:predicted RNA-binding protein associated with RNAse of E/G family
MKRKSAARADWQRIVRRRFVVRRIDTAEYHGYVTLLRLDEVREPMYVSFGEERVCIVDNGYDWLQHFPDGEHFILLAAFDESGEVVQWYIDIIERMGLDEQGVPWYDDLYLDIVVAPNGETLLLDVDELDEALRQGKVNTGQYNFAWKQANALLDALETDLFRLLWLGDAHREQLAAVLDRG